MSKTKRHKWRKGAMPQLCLNCGLIRSRVTFKYLMSITNKPPYNHFKYETRIVYSDTKLTYNTAPNCK